MRGRTKAQALSSYTLALIAALALAGCGLNKQVVKEPVPYPVTVEKFVPLNAELTKPCPISTKKENTVAEAVRLANQNTSALVICAGQIDAIRKVQPKEKAPR